MLRRVHITEIELGMFIHKMEGSWFKHPFWNRRFLLTNPAHLELLLASDIETVIIDTDQGLDTRRLSERAEVGVQTQTQTQMQTGAAPVAAVVPPPRTVSRYQPKPPVRTLLRPSERQPGAVPPATIVQVREFGRARKVIGEANKVISQVFVQARLGKALNVADISNVVDEVYASVQRNLYAFNGLLRCQQDSEYVYRHSLSVSALMVALARQLKLGPVQMREAGMAGLLMDVGVGQMEVDLGAIGGDYRHLAPSLVQSHVLLGHAFLKAAGDIPPSVVDTCLRHHERLDGTGYPYGLGAEAIELLPRMGMVCDLYDNLVTGGDNRVGLDPAVALRHLAEMGDAIDQEVLRALVTTLGVYPIGAFVELASGRLAMVVAEDDGDTALPVVRAFWSLAQGRSIKAESIALSQCFGADSIVGAADLEGLDLPPLGQLRQRLIEATRRELAV
ncbi:HD-GYP domain-containing protein [Novosphingobium sp. FKTRR1]|uniref:HD-GYP domain-containing protein n=1 Tax=Novosphingobium sp. FKTRR1 TaxID=2879118 RepID=UPI001CF013DE|nr:HD-GYP domain-containing protein [Novosphingobium sp. FKTRR1]